jgi:hypothetical protein
MEGADRPDRAPLAQNQLQGQSSSAESHRVVEIPWGLSPGYAGAELTTAQGSGA